MALSVTGAADLRADRRPLRVVIADDYGPMRVLLADLLTGRGCVIAGEAADGQAACDLVGAVACDLVVMDYRMPVLNGLEAIRRIRARHPDVEVVGFSSDNDRWLVEQFLRAGARAHFVKEDVEGLVAHVAAVARAA